MTSGTEVVERIDALEFEMGHILDTINYMLLVMIQLTNENTEMRKLLEKPIGT